jgi:hypothetical protein
MKIKLPRTTPSLVVSACALFVALGGTGYAAGFVLNASNARHLGGQSPGYFAAAHQFGSSGGERFFSAGQTVMLGHEGHFTFTASCEKGEKPGEQTVSFDVTANTAADLDGNGPMPAGTKIVIHEDGDLLNSTKEKELKAGDFTQVGSASDSTEIAPDGEEVDIFYNDGVNWPAGEHTPAHECFAGYTGFRAR